MSTTEKSEFLKSLERFSTMTQQEQLAELDRLRELAIEDGADPNDPMFKMADDARAKLKGVP